MLSHSRFMPALRRFTAALSGALLLQLTLLASGTPCAMHGAGGMGSSAAVHAMPGVHAGAHHGKAPAPHGSSVVSVSATESAPQHSEMPQGCDSSRKGNGCGFPSAPGQCATMATCTTVTVAPSAELATLVAFHAGSPTIAHAELLRSGPAAAPELPPPRA